MDEVREQRVCFDIINLTFLLFRLSVSVIYCLAFRPLFIFVPLFFSCDNQFKVNLELQNSFM